MEKKTKAYKEGERARLSGHLEPMCPYAPGSNDYTEFANGFCEVKPLIAPGDKNVET